MKNNFKKIIASTYLFAIIFGLFLPFHYSLGQNTSSLEITSNKYITVKDSEVTLTAKMVDTSVKLTQESVTIRFYSYPKVEGFDNVAKCTASVDNSWKCSLFFKSSAAGTHKIDGNFNVGSTKYEAKSINIRVCGSAENIVNGLCTEPEPTIPVSTTTPPSVTLPGGNNASVTKDTDVIYEPLAPLPGDDGTLQTEINTQEECAFGKYLNIIIKLIIGISAVLAMVMITMGGIEYMTSELVSEKSAGKDTIQNAILGLLIALGSYLILNTINPELLNVCLDKLPIATIEISPEEIIKNRSGGGTCAPITDSSKPCYPENLKNAFPGTTNDKTPFNTLASQASAICSLESRSISNTTSGVDKCADGKAFSFGLFQINGSAHRNNIAACNGAFSIPQGHGSSQGNKISGTYSWTCTTVEPAYTKCKEYLLNPTNNIAEASKLKKINKWEPTWSTYSSCRNKFNP